MSTPLSAQPVQNTDELLLRLPSGGLTASLQTVSSGDGVDGVLHLSTGGVKSAGTLEVDGQTTLDGNVLLTALTSSQPDGFQVVAIDPVTGTLYRMPMSLFSAYVSGASWRGLPATVLLLPEGFRGTPTGVTSWVDSSGSGNDFTVVGTPVLNTVDGKVVAGCTASGDNFDLSSLAGVTQPFNVAFAVRDYSGSVTLFEDSSAPAVSVEITAATDISVNAGVGDSATFTAGFKIIQVEFNGASSRVRVDSQSWQTFNAGTNVPPSVESLFIGITNAAAFGLWNYALTDAQADLIRDAFTALV